MFFFFLLLWIVLFGLFEILHKIVCRTRKHLLIYISHALPLAHSNRTRPIRVLSQS